MLGDASTTSNTSPRWKWVADVLIVVGLAYLTFLIVSLVRFDGFEFGSDSPTAKHLSTLILGVAIVFGAILLGYFAVLREWLVNQSLIQDDFLRARRKAAIDLAEMEAALRRSERLSELTDSPVDEVRDVSDRDLKR